MTKLAGAGFTLVSGEAIERLGGWSLVRRSLGVASFGINRVEIEPGEEIPEHDEIERDQEEVFFVLSGSPTIVIDGEAHPAPAGTFARLDPELRRTVRNPTDEPTEVLIVSAPRRSGYEPMEWA
ncbi:cupin domain-containing protein [Thermoleophilia bacterium SCSIO 60948]|nr:cupin domain-containing protein [Thermoleophilia bacterium SCSIO 60948]